MIEVKHRYRKFNTYLKQTFGEKVYRVGLYGGFTCPNRDGSLSTSGCSFCNPKSTEPFDFLPGETIPEQLKRGMAYTKERHGANKFIAYFQDYSTTYGSAEELEQMYREAMAVPGIVGLALTTRPDCLPESVLEVLGRLAEETYMWVELGVQSAIDKSLAATNRCHDASCSREAIKALHAKGVAVSAHIILGLPGENSKDEAFTADFVTELKVEAVKLHNLYVVKDTALAQQYNAGTLDLMTLDEYVGRAISFMERLQPSVIIQRLAGDAPRRFTVAPKWSINKMAVLNAIEKRMAAEDRWQGKALGFARESTFV